MPQLILFNTFELNVHKKSINLDTAANGGDTIKIALSNIAPTASWSQLSSVTQIANGQGYTTGGAAATITSLSQSYGTMTWVLGANITWTGGASGMATFRYLYLYSDTSTNDLLIGCIDHGSAVSLASGQSFIYACNGVTHLTVVQ